MSTVRFATFNVHSGKPRNGRPNLKLYRESLSELAADVVGLQEVDVWMLRSGRVDMAGEGANALDSDGLFANARRRWDFGKYGNALLVRGSVEKIDIVRCVRTGKFRERRVAQIARVVVNDVTWNVANTHLSTHADESKVQLKQIAELLASQADGPRVLMGDFNMSPEGVNEILNPLGWNVLESGFTFPSWGPDHTIDFICVKNATAEHVEVKSLPVSDHAALVADLRQA
jgi:endonuclease/exonuclease/phosphatase family metal-dependent hydrolase